MSQHRAIADRTASIETIESESADVLIVGGGIVGAGVARDAALRGLRTVVVEQCDLAFGTSSRSSRLLHGGLRYLAQGRVGLVREASLEKRVLSRIAPHLAQPLPFLFPTYRSAQWRLWQMRIGVGLYDLLCGGRNLGPSTVLGRREVLDYMPGIEPARLTGAVRYYDALTNDARLVVDTLRSAAAAGAAVANYVRFLHAEADASGFRFAVRDGLSGREFEGHALAIVNATGPWSASLPGSGVALRLTKGVHLVVDRLRLPVPDAIVMTEGSRILFAIPWGRRTILGTTDTDYDGPPEDVVADRDDIRYVLDVTNRAFAGARLRPSDVRATWAGLRPLPADKHGRPSDISRAHVIRMTRPGWFDVTGGKLTTYRRIGEQTVDLLLGFLRRDAAQCRTAREPLLPAHEAALGGGIIPPEPAENLVDHFCRNEWAVHLDDVMIRRTSWHYWRDDRAALASTVAGWMADALGWSPEQTAQELSAYGALCR